MRPITPTDFTPWAPLGGGILIGLSAVMVMALLGRIAGISGIAKGVLGAVVPIGSRAKNLQILAPKGAAS